MKLFKEFARPPCKLFIEASAGTGKTWTIERLVFKFLGAAFLKSPKSARLSAILVVTFTENAALEIRGRVENLLLTILADERQALKICQDCGLEALLEAGDLSEVFRAFLENELSDLKNAAVYTIHGFCSAVLGKNALELGMSLSRSPDNEGLQRDFWEFARTTLWGKSWEDVGLAIGATPMDVEAGFWCIPRVLPSASSEVRKAYEAFVGLERRGRFDESLYFIDWPYVSRLKTAVEEIAREVAGEISAPPQNFLMKLFNFISEEGYKSKEADQSPYARAFRIILECFADGQLVTRGARVPFTATEMQKAGKILFALWAWPLLNLLHVSFEQFRTSRKSGSKTITFDDMISDLEHALTSSPGAGNLLRSLRDQYTAVLIDEFQDTDPRQWSIFHRLAFGPGSENTSLVVVGDPKQAIYGFRGGDLNTYLNARREFQSIGAPVINLDTNYRSDPDLLEILNEAGADLYGTEASADIRYERVLAGAGKSCLNLGGTELPHFGLIPILEAETLPSQRKEIFQCVADLVDRLLHLEDLEMIDGNASRRVGTRDIAILVEASAHGASILKMLAAKGIPASLSGRAGLGDSAEARRLLILLNALQNPADRGFVRMLALSWWMGLNVEALGSSTGEVLIEGIAERLRRDAEEIADLGLPSIVRRWEEGERGVDSDLWIGRARANPLAVAREWTNIHHLVEYIEELRVSKEVPVHRLGSWFESLCQGRALGDEASLRKDRDDDAVRIMTMHGSKGLEFPIVFCLFGIGKVQHRDPVFNLDLGSRKVRAFDLLNLDPERQEAARISDLKNLLYVALTRAQTAVFMAQLPEPKKGAASDIVKFMTEGLIKPDRYLEHGNLVESLCRATRRRTELAGASLAETGPGQVPDWTVAPRPKERLWSFTGLSRFLHEDYSDSQNRARVVISRSDDELGGEQFGIAFHSLMENLAFQELSSWNGTEEDFLSDRPALLAILGNAGYSASRDQQFALKLARRACAVSLTGIGHIGSSTPRIEYKEITMMAKIWDAPKWQRLFKEFGMQADGVSGESGVFQGSLDYLARGSGTWQIADWKTNRMPEDSAQTEGEIRRLMEHYTLQGVLYQAMLHLALLAKAGIQDPVSRPALDLLREQVGNATFIFVRALDDSLRSPLPEPSGDGLVQPGVFVVAPDAERIIAVHETFGFRIGGAQ